MMKCVFNVKNVILDVTLKVSYHHIILYIVRHLLTNVWSQIVAAGLKENGNLQTTFIHMTKLCLSVTHVILLQNSINIQKSIKSGMKKTYRTNAKYATKGFSTVLAGNDTQTKIINELLYVAVLFVSKCVDAQVLFN